MPRTRELWADEETAAFLHTCYDLPVRVSILVPAGQLWAVGRPRPVVDVQLPPFHIPEPRTIEDVQLPEYQQRALPVAPFRVEPGGVLSPL